MRVTMILSALLVCLPLLAAVAPAQTPPPPPFSPAVVAGDFVYLSGALATDQAGKIVTGGIREQTARALEILAGRLKENGSRLEQVASVTVYLKDPADFAAMNEVYAKHWPKDPPTRTTVVAHLVVPEALIEIAMVALKDGVEREVVHPSSWLRSPNPYSYGIRSRDTLFLSGLVSRSGKDNTVVKGDITAQTGVVLQNAREILAAAGMSLADVASAKVYITDTALFQDMNAAYREAFPANPPARATVRCALMSPDYVVEVTMLAVKSAGRTAVAAPSAPAATPAQASPRPALSQAIQVGNRLFVSGTLGQTDANRGDAGGQTREVLKKIGVLLEHAGFGWKDVVDAVVYLPSLDDFAAMNGAYRDSVPSPYPARATIQAGLVAPGALVEIMVTAARR
jgi:2-iminobutanoate/2-iminopropanoate deaminase